MTLGSIIRKYRNNIGLSISDLAEKIDSSHGAVWNWEHDVTFPTFDKVIEIEKVLGIGVINKSFLKNLYKSKCSNCEKACE